MATSEVSSVSPSGLLQRGSLLRVLGVAFGLAVIIGNTIGSGILRTPGVIATKLPHPWLFLSVWVIGGIYALFGAFSISELRSEEHTSELQSRRDLVCRL